MLSSLYEIQHTLISELKQIDNIEDGMFKKAVRSIYCISNYLKRLKEYIRENKFQNKEYEIQFFKTINRQYKVSSSIS